MGDLVIALIILISTVYGVKRGFLRAAVGAVSSLAATVLSLVFYKPFSALIYNSPIGEAVKKSIGTELSGHVPSYSAAGIILNSTDSFEYAAAVIAVNALSFILLVIIIKIVVQVVIRIFVLAGKLPLIKQANSLLGAAAGFVGGVIICYLLICFADAVGSVGAFSSFSNMINSSYLSAFFYKPEIITNIFKK